MTAPRKPETMAAAESVASNSACEADQAPAGTQGNAAPLCRYEELAERENRLRAREHPPE